MTNQDHLYEFSDSICDSYIFESDKLKSPIPPTRFSLHDNFTPESIRKLADDLESYNIRLKLYQETLAKNVETNENVVSQFVNDVVAFLKLADHPKRDAIVKYCKSRVKSPKYTLDYLRDLFWEFVYVMEIV